ncbi:MAG: NAD-dependent epimerase/dehydratase family protein [Pseudomonadota bacterium]
MRVMILGCGGAIGRAAADALTAAGIEPVGVRRRGEAGGFPGRVLAADRDDPAAIARLCEAERIETVIDMVAMSEASTTPLFDPLAGRIERYVLISSCDVYRNYGLLHRSETGEALAAPACEDSPLRSNRYPYRAETPRAADDPARWMDDYDKIPVEDAARAQAGFEWTILRLPMVYGPGDRQRRFRWLAEPILAGADEIAAPAAWLDWRTSYGFVGDVGAAIACAATDPRAFGEAFNLGDAAHVDHRAWIARFADAAGWRGAVRDDPAPGSPLAAAASALDLAVPLLVSTDKIRTELGFVEPVSLADRIARTIADERARV